MTDVVGCRPLPVTCGRDGHQHLVADEAIDAAHAGRYEALCQHQVWAVAAAYPPGPPCPHCVAVREPHRWSWFSTLEQVSPPPDQPGGDARAADLPATRSGPSGTAPTSPERAAMTPDDSPPEATTAQTRPVVLARYRPGTAG